MARLFNGATDQVTTGNFSLSAAASLSLWVKANSNANAYSGLFSHRDAAPVNFLAVYLKSTGKYAWYARATTLLSVDPGTATNSNGAWTHLALTYDSVGGLKTYVNGTSDGTVAANGVLLTGAASVSVLMGYDNYTGATAHLVGSLADVAEWSVALTVAEITALATGARPHTIRPASLNAYWPLDGISSPEPDLSGNARNGTVTGTTIASGPPIAMSTSRWPSNTEIAAPSFIAAWARQSNPSVIGAGTI